MRPFATSIAFVVGTLLLSAPARAEDTPPELPDAAKPAATDADKGVAQLAAAAALVEQARATKSAVAMVAAVQMIRTVQVKSGGPLGDKIQNVGEEKKGEAKKTAKGALLDPKALLDEARQFAGNDATLIALVDREAARKADAAGSERMYGGAACANGRVGAGQYTVWNIDVIPRTYQEVLVISDGDCDIDCYAVDQAGHIFRGDNDYTAHCLVNWWTTYGGRFRFIIDNRRCGVYADYRVCGD